MNETALDTQLLEFEDSYKTLSTERLAERAVQIATNQIIACTDFKKPRILTLDKYWRLYDGKTNKKLRQLFNIPIPVFAGMIDTLNSQYDSPIRLDFSEGDPADYFKVGKIKAAWDMEVLNTSTDSKWDDKLRMSRKHAIINGIGIVKYNVDSEPEYHSTIENVRLSNFIFQPRGGLYLENHLFNGEEDIEKTRFELIAGAKSGIYNKAQVLKLIKTRDDKEYLPDSKLLVEKIDRFKPLSLDPNNHSYVGVPVYKLVQQIMEIDGQRWIIVFDPWTSIWIRFEKWSDICSSGLYPWDKFATHEDDENILSKSYGDDLYAAADAIVGMFNQEMTNREKINLHARAYDMEMFPDVRKLDEAQHRPDALVPADTKGGTRRISEGIYEFKVGELNGTVNLIDWITGTLGRNTGATDLNQGSVENNNKKASVAFAEQKAVSKRIGWGSASFQSMMGSLGKKYIYGLKDHMPSKMAIKILGEHGFDWDEITRLDLNTKKDVDILIKSTDAQELEDNMKLEKRTSALAGLAQNPKVNQTWLAEETLRSVGGYDEVTIAVALDVNTYADRKSIAHAAEAIQMILQNQKPSLWYGATPAFMQKIVDFAIDNKSKLKGKYTVLLDYATSHAGIAKANVERKASQDRAQMSQQNMTPTSPAPAQPTPAAVNPGVPGGISKAMMTAGIS